MEPLCEIFSSTCKMTGSKSGKNLVEKNMYMKSIMLSHVSTKNNELSDENGNTSSSLKLCSSGMCSNTLVNDSDVMSMENVNNHFKELGIESYTDQTDGNERKGKLLAGNIINVITALNTVIVQAFSDTLLYFRTPLYIYSTSFQKKKASAFILLGHVDDIFGSIGEPLYSVTVACNLQTTLNIGEAVYYLADDPNTEYMRVEHTRSDSSSKIKYNIKIGNML